MNRDQAIQREIRPLGAPRQHYWLAKRMAKATGVDLVQAMQDARLDQSDWSTLVQRCRGCAWVNGCERWLDQGGEDVRDLPDGCANRTRFAALQGQDQKEDQ